MGVSLQRTNSSQRVSLDRNASRSGLTGLGGRHSADLGRAPSRLHAPGARSSLEQSDCELPTRFLLPSSSTFLLRLQAAALMVTAAGLMAFATRLR